MCQSAQICMGSACLDIWDMPIRCGPAGRKGTHFRKIHGHRGKQEVWLRPQNKGKKLAWFYPEHALGRGGILMSKREGGLGDPIMAMEKWKMGT